MLKSNGYHFKIEEIVSLFKTLIRIMCRTKTITFEINNLEVEILYGKLEVFYQKLELGIVNILKMVEDDTNFKGIYNPQKDIINECSDKEEFIKFQSLLKNLNTYVYYYSLILVGFSLFEYFLKSICEFVSEHINPKVEFDFLKGDTLHNCRVYLSKKTHLIDFKDDNLEIHYIGLKEINHLRNLIAHHNGNLFQNRSLPLEKQKHFEQLKRNKHISINNNGQVYITDAEYIKVFVANSKEFLNLILNRLEKNNKT